MSKEPIMEETTTHQPSKVEEGANEKELRLKKLKRGTIAALILGAIGIVFQVVPTLQAFGGFFFVPAVGILVYTTMQKKRVNCSFCPNCGKKYDYETDISWEELERNSTEKSVKAKVEFECSCSNCGHVNEFTKEFTVATLDPNGNIKHHNISSLARKYFVK